MNELVFACIDPGPRYSGFSMIKIESASKAELLLAVDIDNERLLRLLSSPPLGAVDALVYEKPALAGQKRVQEHVFDTAEEAGRMKQAFIHHNKPIVPITRQIVKLELLRGNPKNADTVVKNYLIGRHGEVGNKNNPGPLSKFIGQPHSIQATAAGLAVWDKVNRKELILSDFVPAQVVLTPPEKSNVRNKNTSSENGAGKESSCDSAKVKRVSTGSKRKKQ